MSFFADVEIKNKKKKKKKKTNDQIRDANTHSGERFLQA